MSITPNWQDQLYFIYLGYREMESRLEAKRLKEFRNLKSSNIPSPAAILFPLLYPASNIKEISQTMYLEDEKDIGHMARVFWDHPDSQCSTHYPSEYVSHFQVVKHRH